MLGVWLGAFLLSSCTLHADPVHVAKEMALGSPVTSSNAFLKPYQTMTLGVPPLPPSQFNPDPRTTAYPPRLFPEEIRLRLSTRISPSAPQSPARFNPDPPRVVTTSEPFYRTNFVLDSVYGDEPVDNQLALPRDGVRLREFVAVPGRPPDRFGLEPVPQPLALPRTNTIANQRIEHEFETPEYPLARKGLGYPPNATPVTNRWSVGFTPWRRYTSGKTETPYQTATPELWHPYKQSILKGDVPIYGQDVFLNLTAGSQTEFETRRLPTPSGVSAARANSAEFFGQSEQLSVQQNFSFAAELFKGETVFQPTHWTFRIEPVFNVNYIDVKEANAVSPDPRGDFDGGNPTPGNGGVVDPGDVGPIIPTTPAPDNLSGGSHTTRTRTHIALQDASFEYHLGDLSVNYDFFALKSGIQSFNSDFRGFIFNDANLGMRLFGNAQNNLYQYNVGIFEMLEKDTYSDLNTFRRRDQRVFVANLYRQDFLTKGYTAQLSFHANMDEGGLHYDENNVIARPAPIGTVMEHDVNAFYFGWAGDGHLGRLNINHAFYQVVGRDDFNGIAGRPTDINAQMFALELSYDHDWIRYKGSFFYASGDDNAEDGTATGFDSILDNANFTGGPFSYFVHQGFNLAGSSVSLKTRNSLLPDLRTSKTEGQANFVNPGVIVLGVGTEMELTPKLRSFMNLNYLRFAETDTIKTVLLTDKIDGEIGLDLSVGIQYRPLLTDNIIISAGFGTLIPGKGYEDIYRRNTQPVVGYGSNQTGKADDFLYSGLLAITFTY
ncbi:MAG: hypothetical protein JWM68_2000 [Verrucomicrobiales bacterium]|nr:hypothetical protein [Verrucomicrobiales bacterium]